MLSNEIKSYIQTQLKVDGGHISDVVELDGGKSEARVYRAKIVSSSRDLSGVYIIKLISTDALLVKAAVAAAPIRQGLGVDTFTHISGKTIIIHKKQQNSTSTIW